MFFTERKLEVVFSIERQDALISSCHSGTQETLQSRASSGHMGCDKIIAALNQRFLIPLLKQRVQMYIKYCEPCQCNNTRKLEKCPHVMVPIKIKGKPWSQIGKE